MAISLVLYFTYNNGLYANELSLCFLLASYFITACLHNERINYGETGSPERTEETFPEPVVREPTEEEQRELILEMNAFADLARLIKQIQASQRKFDFMMKDGRPKRGDKGFRYGHRNTSSYMTAEMEEDSEDIYCPWNYKKRCEL